jgi:hypothetical protein
MHAGLKVLASLNQSIIIIGVEFCFSLSDSGLDVRLKVCRNLVPVVLKHFFRLEHKAIKLVAGLNGLPSFLIFLSVNLGVLNHALDLVLTHTSAGLDRDPLLFARSNIFRGNREDTVGVDIKRNLNLRHAAWSGRDINKTEATQGLVVASHLTLTLENMNLNRGLAIRGG